MANYTLELRTLTNNNVEIFDFDYPIFDEKYRSVLEEKFINHFYFREIGFETISRFKHHLKSQLNLLMPIYNKMYNACNLELRILDNYEIKESFEKSSSASRTGINESTNKKLFSDTGRKRVDINDIDYVSNIAKELDNNTSNINDDNNEKWVREMVGNIGVATDMDAIVNYLNGLRNVDLMLFDELDNLFMQVF